MDVGEVYAGDDGNRSIFLPWVTKELGKGNRSLSSCPGLNIMVPHKCQPREFPTSNLNLGLCSLRRNSSMLTCQPFIQRMWIPSLSRQISSVPLLEAYGDRSSLVLSTVFFSLPMAQLGPYLQPLPTSASRISCDHGWWELKSQPRELVMGGPTLRTCRNTSMGWTLLSPFSRWSYLAQKGSLLFPRSHTLWVAEWGFEPGSLALESCS